LSVGSSLVIIARFGSLRGLGTLAARDLDR
jgi:hypothetical protein